MTYDCVVVFHKMTTLTSYFAANEHKLIGHLDINDHNYEARYDRIADRYTAEQDVRLLLLVRHEYNPETHKFKTICKINCPVNPLPVKDEFTAASVNAVKNFLLLDGWTETESICANMLK